MRKKIFLVTLIVIISSFLLDNVVAETYNNYTESMVSCGQGLMTNIPTMIPKVISIVYTVIQIAVPVVLVIMGSLDLFKGIIAQKEDEIKKGQQMFVKRLIAAALVFFVFVIVKVVVSLVADGTSNRIMECAECFIENECDKGFFETIADKLENIQDSKQGAIDDVNEIIDDAKQ